MAISHAHAVLKISIREKKGFKNRYVKLKITVTYIRVQMSYISMKDTYLHKKHIEGIVF